jgi:hypothetical protein
VRRRAIVVGAVTPVVAESLELLYLAVAFSWARGFDFGGPPSPQQVEAVTVAAIVLFALAGLHAVGGVVFAVRAHSFGRRLLMALQTFDVGLGIAAMVYGTMWSVGGYLPAGTILVGFAVAGIAVLIISLRDCKRAESRTHGAARS